MTIKAQHAPLSDDMFFRRHDGKFEMTHSWQRYFGRVVYNYFEQLENIDDLLAVQSLLTPTNALAPEIQADIDDLRSELQTIPTQHNYDVDIKRLEDLITSESLKIKKKYPEAWPVGSIFISTVSTNPLALLGYGTWETFGTGRVLIGIDPGDGDFDEAEETGGAKTHDHPSTTSGAPSATETVDNDGAASTVAVASSAHTHDTDLVDIDHMPPFIAVYLWKRTS